LKVKYKRDAMGGRPGDFQNRKMRKRVHQSEVRTKNASRSGRESNESRAEGVDPNLREKEVTTSIQFY